jgi:hypothetical protein
LEELIVYKNQLTVVEPKLFGSMKKLHTLLMSDNKLNALPMDLGTCARVHTPYHHALTIQSPEHKLNTQTLAKMHRREREGERERETERSEKKYHCTLPTPARTPATRRCVCC